MLTSNLGKTEFAHFKILDASFVRLSIPFFHTPCVEKKHSTCYIISFFIEARRSNLCESMYLRDYYLVKFTFLFLRTAVHLPTSNLPYLEFTSNGAFHSRISEIFFAKNHKSNPAQKYSFNFHKPANRFLGQHAVTHGTFTRGTFTELLKLNQLTAVDKA